jgi:hypothetical protein
VGVGGGGGGGGRPARKGDKGQVRDVIICPVIAADESSFRMKVVLFTTSLILDVLYTAFVLSVD